MESAHRLLIDVWREACRHIEIHDALERIAPLLPRQLPADRVFVRRLLVDRGRIETVAEWSLDDSRAGGSRAELAPARMEAALAWCRKRELIHAPSNRFAGDLQALLPDGVSGDVLAAPLAGEHGVLGALVLVNASREPFSREDEQIALALQDPFTVALENDRRLHELITLREKADAENRSLLSKLGRGVLSETVIGAETGLREVMQGVSLVANADVPVLILGETGSGKEVVARAIHNQSPRRDGPFVRVNCGAIPAELVDTELFGHEKGSFTGATAERKGWFERADGGTLFLDECGELTLAAQVRLLRVLQDGTFERVGGERQLHVDVRVVAATHRPMKEMVGEGTFREDLWYRLAVFPLYLPALRERQQDIPEMAAHFAAKAASRFGLKQCAPTDNDLELLLGYSWPGNVRELGAVIERAAILGQGRYLNISAALGQPAPATTPRPEPQSSPHVAFDSPVRTLDDAMRDHIEVALKRTHGRIEGAFGAAELLGINPHTLRARMRKLKIRWQDFRRVVACDA